jgi:hypothetical protein
LNAGREDIQCSRARFQFSRSVIDNVLPIFFHFMKNKFLMNRREFLYKTGSVAAALSARPRLFGESATSKPRPLDASTLAKFVDASHPRSINAG